MRRGACLLALLLTAAAPTPAPTPTPQQLRESEQARDAALAAQREAAARAAAAAEQERTLAGQRVAAAARLREAEDALAAAAAAVADLERRRAGAEARLATRAAQLGPVLPVIERLSLYPAETLLAMPMAPEDAVRGAIVLAGITHAIAEDAAQLRAQQTEVAALHAKLDAAMPALEKAEAEQRDRAAALDAALEASRQTRADAEDAAAEAARRAATDAARADSLRTALERIEADRRLAEARAREQAAAADRKRQQAAAAAARARQEALARPAGPGVGEPRSQLTSPVAGSIVRSFGQDTGAGPANGLTFQAPPGARVVSPCGGRVEFAGPFRSYGLLVIVDCGGGWHFVLAGLDRLDTAAGRPVAAGEPVGAMAVWDPRSPAATRPSLYVELRRHGEPVNPAPFLRARS